MRAAKTRLARALGLCVLAYAGAALPAEPGDRDRVVVGRELFVREWVPQDPRARGGDGLGPMYNAASCVACHRMGGPGGAGLNDHNVQLLVPELVPPRNNIKEAPEPDKARLVRDELVPLH